MILHLRVLRRCLPLIDSSLYLLLGSYQDLQSQFEERVWFPEIFGLRGCEHLLMRNHDVFHGCSNCSELVFLWGYVELVGCRGREG